MSISKSDFEKGKFRGRFRGNPILVYLFKNKDKAFKTLEISDAIKISPNHVNVVLNWYKKKGIVCHKSPYWKLNKDGIKYMEKGNKK